MIIYLSTCILGFMMHCTLIKIFTIHITPQVVRDESLKRWIYVEKGGAGCQDSNLGSGYPSGNFQNQNWSLQWYHGYSNNTNTKAVTVLLNRKREGVCSIHWMYSIELVGCIIQLCGYDCTGCVCVYIWCPFVMYIPHSSGLSRHRVSNVGGCTTAIAFCCVVSI